MSNHISLEDTYSHYGSVLDRETIVEIHSEVRGRRSDVVEQLGMLTGMPPPKALPAAPLQPPPTAGGGDVKAHRAVAPHPTKNPLPVAITTSTTAPAQDQQPAPEKVKRKEQPPPLPVVIALEEATSHYGDALDADTIRDIHNECRGNRSEVCDQLTMLSGIAAPKPGGEDATSSTMGSPMPTGMSEEGTVSLGGVDISAYDDAIATGEELKKLERDKELNDLMKRKVEDVGKLFESDRKFDAEVARQRAAGPQSTRGASLEPMIKSHPKHSQDCFHRMLAREKEHCGDFVCFYHSYSLASVLYEVNSCIARVIYGLPDDFAPSARLLKKPFKKRPHMSFLIDQFSQLGSDHNPEFRAVAICASVSLHSPSSEAPPISTFAAGYSLSIAFQPLLDGILKEAGATDADVVKMRKAIVQIADEHQLHGALYGGKSTGFQPQGQMLQIFVRADCVDDIAYGAQPGGTFIPGFNPPSKYLTTKDKAPDGQARVFWHPSLFFDPSKVKVYHYAANRDYDQGGRAEVQRKIQQALAPILGSPEAALNTFYALEGHEPPKQAKEDRWW